MTLPPPSENRDSGRWKEPIGDDQWIAKAQARAWGAPEYKQELETDIRKELPRDKQPASLTGVMSIPPSSPFDVENAQSPKSAQHKTMDCPSCRLVGSTIGLGIASYALYKTVKPIVPIQKVVDTAANIASQSETIQKLKHVAKPNRYTMTALGLGSLGFVIALNWDSLFKNKSSRTGMS